MFESYNLDGILICTLLFAFLLLYAVSHKNNIQRGVILYPHILILIFCVFAFWSQDYYGYIEAIKFIDLRFPDAEQRTHLERLYIWIGYFVNGDYTLFRLCVWGVSYILFLKTLQNLGIHNKQTIALFIVYFLLIFSYARVSLGMASLFYGASLILKIDNWRIGQILKIGVGLAMLFLAYNAHKSMFVAIAIFPFIFLRLNKYTLLLFATAFISVAVIVGGDIISALLLDNTMDDEYGEFIQESATNYFTSNSQDDGIASKLISFIQTISLVLPIVYCYINSTAAKYISTNFTLRCFVNYSTLLLLIGISFGLVLSFSSPISYRLMFMAYIPNIVIISTLYKNRVLSQIDYDRFFLLFTLYSVLRLSYTLYCQLVL